MADAFADAILRARQRLERDRAGALRDLTNIYRWAARGVRGDVAAATPGTLRQRHLLALVQRLEVRARELTEEVLDAIASGIRLAVRDAVAAPAEVAGAALSHVLDPRGVRALFADVNERATAALLARTGPDGLLLSDRVWRIGQHWRRAAQSVLEDGVARGESARTLARDLQRYLLPGVFTAHKREVRKRVGVPTDVSYEAMRLARAEISVAFHEGTILGNGAAPSYEGIIWRLSAAHQIPDVCDDLAASTRFGRPGFYPKGEEPAKPHPQCQCVALPQHEDPDALTDRLIAWVHDPASQPDLERWYAETGKRFVGRPLTPSMSITSRS